VFSTDDAAKDAMKQVLAAVGRALGDLRDRRIIAVLVLPMLGALALWTALGWWLWPDLAAWLSRIATETFVGKWVESVGAGWLIRSAATVTLIALWIPAILVTAMLATEIVAMPVIVSRVGERYYPQLAKKAGGTTAGSIVNALFGVVAFCALWLATLPLWLTGIAAAVLPLVLSGYLNQRLFRYDALADHADRREFRELTRRARGRLFLLGVMTASLYYVPLVNLVAPTASGLAFTHFCLAELARLRSAKAAEGKKPGAP
jgi:uncharacterized protein involved in cysteine biosynthesis